MQFQNTWRRIVTGEKTQTRRPTQLGDQPEEEGAIILGVRRSGHLLWRVGKSYAVQPGRGKRALNWADVYEQLDQVPASNRADDLPLRICLERIRREDVRQISAKDARAEGFADVVEFLVVWTRIYDRRMLTPFLKRPFQEGEAMTMLAERPDHLYDAWALNFHLEPMEV